jgi:hypothetical protein
MLLTDQSSQRANSFVVSSIFGVAAEEEGCSGISGSDLENRENQLASDGPIAQELAFVNL